ncbi:hypothetical protein PI87_23910 [Ralstonia sp. A12]|uniref:DUF305 domain-containing protein n=1 Tax=Ralstonia sp. A12 TaxID=1217052 RepID=UPI0005742D33|nr:DUF305 domain-containing protein [Ralstonia sp. A12]KHK50133.1 hypothetical protein PI87_23910 [Ralstonia sp. A12]
MRWIKTKNIAATALLAVTAVTTWAGALTQQEAFRVENEAAMDKMMAAMEIKPSGDIDRDFAAKMIPHHQGAIDMALAELRYGSNEQLRRIAQEIIVEQQQEIAAMQIALGEQLPPSVPVPTQVGAAARAAAAPEHHHSSH